MNNLNEDQQQKDKVCKVVQKFLKDPPVIIWGSGATIPYGLPSMDDLKKSLQITKHCIFKRKQQFRSRIRRNSRHRKNQ